MKFSKSIAVGLSVYLASAGLSAVRAEVTMDDVRNEVQRQLKESNAKSEQAEAASQLPTWIDQSQINFQGGKGLPIVKSPTGELSISGYMLVRYLNQLPPNQTYQDHLGVSHNIDASNFISAPHRVLLNFQGWIYDPKFLYCTTLWTVNATDKNAIIGYLAYAFSKKFTLSAGVGSLPGVRTLTYSHPYWLGSDRLMAEEYFRPGFTQGIWAQGEVTPGFNYHVMIGNNLTTLNVNALEDSRDFAYSGNVWWTPTTHEFGPRGGTGDFENHQKLATRFGIAYTQGIQNAATSSLNNMPDSTQIRMADSLLPFSAGAIVPGVTVDKVTYKMTAADAAIKIKGLFVQVQGFARKISNFRDAGGTDIGVDGVLDLGCDLQASYMLQPKKTEIYLGTSYVSGDKDAGYRDSHEFVQGLNRYLAGTRNSRLNLHVIEVYKSPTSSVFGYYVGGLKGVIVSAGWSILF